MARTATEVDRDRSAAARAAALAAAEDLRSELTEARQRQHDVESALSRIQAEFEQLAAQQAIERHYQIDAEVAAA